MINLIKKSKNIRFVLSLHLPSSQPPLLLRPPNTHSPLQLLQFTHSIRYISFSPLFFYSFDKPRSYSLKATSVPALRQIRSKICIMENKSNPTFTIGRSSDSNPHFPLLGKGSYSPIQTYPYPIIFDSFTKDMFCPYALFDYKDYVVHSHDSVEVNPPKAFLLEKVDLKCCLGIISEENPLVFHQIRDFALGTWGNAGLCNVFSGGDRIFIFQFSSTETMNEAMKDSPVICYSDHTVAHVLTLIDWYINPIPRDIHAYLPKKVWVTLVGIPLKYSSPQGLNYLVNVLGPPGDLDLQTTLTLRNNIPVSVARISVYLLANAPRPSTIWAAVMEDEHNGFASKIPVKVLYDTLPQNVHYQLQKDGEKDGVTDLVSQSSGSEQNDTMEWLDKRWMRMKRVLLSILFLWITFDLCILGFAFFH